MQEMFQGLLLITIAVLLITQLLVSLVNNIISGKKNRKTSYHFSILLQVIWILLFIITGSLQELLFANSGQRLEVVKSLFESLLGGIVLDCLYPQMHLVLGRVGDAVACEHDAGVHQENVTESVAQGVVLFVKYECSASISGFSVACQNNQSFAVGFFGLTYPHSSAKFI